jgi:hypothetical protein
MAALLKINTATTPVSLKQASGTDYDYAVNLILTQFTASVSNANITVNPASTTGLTLIGTFTDTYLNATPGQHPIGTTPISVTYNFYQDQSAAAETLTRPVEFDTTIKEQSDTNLNADLIATALANLVSTGVGSYALQPSSPTGGTWVSTSTITNTLDAVTTNTTQLWKKTAAATTPTTLRPIKINGATSPVSLKEMSDAEIQSLATRLKNRLASTGIGTYKIQGTTPAGGTWVTSGASFLDTTRTSSSVSYSGTYSGTYTGTYTGSYTGTYSGTYTGSYTGSYTGNYTGTYRPSFNGFLGGFFSGTYTGFYSGTYIGNYTGGYAGGYSGTYTGSYTGSYTGGYAGDTLNNDSSTVSTIYLWVRTA